MSSPVNINISRTPPPPRKKNSGSAHDMLRILWPGDPRDDFVWGGWGWGLIPFVSSWNLQLTVAASTQEELAWLQAVPYTQVMFSRYPWTHTWYMVQSLGCGLKLPWLHAKVKKIHRMYGYMFHQIEKIIY